MINKNVFCNLFHTFDYQYNAIENLYNHLCVKESIFDTNSPLVYSLNYLAGDIADAAYKDDWAVFYERTFSQVVSDALFHFVWALQQSKNKIIMITKDAKTGEEKNFISIDVNDLGAFYDLITSSSFYNLIVGLQECLLSSIEWEIKGDVEY